MEGQHPIEGLMKTALDSIKSMIDVNTILGEPVETPDGKVIVPVSRVTFGFAAGGSEYETTKPETAPPKKGDEVQTDQEDYPFGGGSGAGVSIQPMGFLIVGDGDMRLLPIGGQAAIYDRLLDLAPKVIDQLRHGTKTDISKNNSAIKSKEKVTITYKTQPDPQ